jgi:hypothetical protein
MTGSPQRRGWLLVIGVTVVVVGLVAAGALWFAAGQRLDDNVAGFARAPSGCATTLDFDRTGAFQVHLETAGTVDGLAGNCSAAADYDRGDVAAPQLELVDADGDVVAIEPADGGAYDASGFRGERIGVVEITTVGDHVLTVQADGPQFAIAIGEAADDGVALLQWSAMLTAVAALVVGGLLLVAGIRRPTTAEPSTESWEPVDGSALTWPAGPPGFPPPPPTTGAAGPAGPPIAPPTGSPGTDRPPWGPPTQ